jgi:hypothetical protein
MEMKALTELRGALETLREAGLIDGRLLIAKCDAAIGDSERTLRALRELEAAIARLTGNGGINVYSDDASNLSAVRGIARDVIKEV